MNRVILENMGMNLKNCASNRNMALAAGMICLMGSMTALVTAAEDRADAGARWSTTSPDGKLSITVTSQTGLSLSVERDGHTLIPSSPIGVVLSHSGTFPGDLRFTGKRDNRIDETYEMPVGKRSVCHNHANETVLDFGNDDGTKFSLIVRAYNEGAAYRYQVRGSGDDSVTGESSSFRIPAGSKGWLAHYVSHYESFYKRHSRLANIDFDIQVPALFETPDKYWIYLTEADVDGTYAGARLRVSDAAEGRLTYVWDQAPASSLPWTMPWRVAIVVKDLKQLVETTLVNDLGKPSAIADLSWIKPGTASFPWITGPFTHNSDPKIMKQFIDMASEMGWPWIEFDNAWITLGDGPEPEKWMPISWIPEVVAYAKAKNVDVYGWDQWKNLDSPEKREKILGYLVDHGFKGIKVDFLDSDSQERYALREILARDCAERKLLISYHGDITPRGMQRTWPNIATFEGVAGEEYFTGHPEAPTPKYNVNLVFTRNVAGSMDYTPTSFDLQGPNETTRRLSSNAHQMALAVVFESGWQSMGATPKSLEGNPAREFLKNLPAAWDEVRFIDGRPDAYAVVARRKGADWWIAGINGDVPNQAKIPLDFLKSGKYETKLYRDETAESSHGFDVTLKNDKGINAVISWIELWSDVKPAEQLAYSQPGSMDPAPEGYFLIACDNCGTPEGAAHLVKTSGQDYTWRESDIPTSTLIAADPGRTLHCGSTELKYYFKNIDPKANYILRVMYSNNSEPRTQSLSVNGRTLHEPIELSKQKTLFRSFKILGSESKPLPGPEPLDTVIAAVPVTVDTLQPLTVKMPASGGFGILLKDSAR